MGAATVDMYQYEHDLRDRGFETIAGVDETGRGAWAGPLVVAAAILPEGFELDGIRDSKKLSRTQRAEAFEHIVSGGNVFLVCWVEPGTIDRYGLDRCNLRLLRRAAHKLDPEPDSGSLPDGFGTRRSGHPVRDGRKRDVGPGHREAGGDVCPGASR